MKNYRLLVTLLVVVLCIGLALLQRDVNTVTVHAAPVRVMSSVAPQAVLSRATAVPLRLRSEERLTVSTITSTNVKETKAFTTATNKVLASNSTATRLMSRARVTTSLQHGAAAPWSSLNRTSTFPDMAELPLSSQRTGAPRTTTIVTTAPESAPRSQTNNDTSLLSRTTGTAADVTEWVLPSQAQRAPNVALHVIVWPSSVWTDASCRVVVSSAWSLGCNVSLTLHVPVALHVPHCATHLRRVGCDLHVVVRVLQPNVSITNLLRDEVRPRANITIVTLISKPVSLLNLNYWRRHNAFAARHNASVGFVSSSRASWTDVNRTAFRDVPDGRKVDVKLEFVLGLVVQRGCHVNITTGEGLPLIASTTEADISAALINCSRIIPLETNGDVPRGAVLHPRPNATVQLSLRSVLRQNETCLSTARLAYHLSTLKIASRLNAIGRLLAVVATYPLYVDVYVHSNEAISLEELGLTQASLNLSYTNLVYQRLSHNFLLAWVPRWLMRTQHDAGLYDAYIYAEDDLEIRPATFTYWCRWKDALRHAGHVVGFVRWEYLDGVKVVTDAGGMDWLQRRRHTFSGVDFNEKTGNRYTGFWMVDREELGLFISSPKYYRPLHGDPSVVGGGMQREEAAWFHGPQQLRSGASLLMLDSSGSVDDAVFVWHVHGMQGTRWRDLTREQLDQGRRRHRMPPWDSWRSTFVGS